MREPLTVLNAFVHDVATGTWISSLALTALLEAESRTPTWASALTLVPPLERKFMWLTWGSLAVIVLTGLVRMATFRIFGWTGDVARDRVRLLKIKHAILGIAFVAGTWWQAALVYG